MKGLSDIHSIGVIFQYSGDQLLLLLEPDPDNSSRWRLPKALIDHTLPSLGSIKLYLSKSLAITPENFTYSEQLYTFEWGGGQINICNMLLARNIPWRKPLSIYALFDPKNLPPVSAEDLSMINYALSRLKSKALYTNLPCLLLPDPFSLGQYQKIFETLTNSRVDRRNFYRKLQKSNHITPAKNTGKNRLFTSLHKNLQILSNPFRSIS